jgi:hypothetical protein
MGQIINLFTEALKYKLLRFEFEFIGFDFYITCYLKYLTPSLMGIKQQFNQTQLFKNLSLFFHENCSIFY